MPVDAGRWRHRQMGLCQANERRSFISGQIAFSTAAAIARSLPPGSCGAPATHGRLIRDASLHHPEKQTQHHHRPRSLRQTSRLAAATELVASVSLDQTLPLTDRARQTRSDQALQP